MLSMRDIQDKFLDILPTYRGELQKLEDRLIFCGAIQYHLLSETYVRGGRHIFGHAPEDSAHAGSYVPIDYVPCDHGLYVIRHDQHEVHHAYEVAHEARGDTWSPSEMRYHAPGHESCPLCGKTLQVTVSELLDTRDLVLVCCPSFKEGEVTVDVLPIFSAALVKGSYSSSLSIPFQRSKNAMTRVSSNV